MFSQPLNFCLEELSLDLTNNNLQQAAFVNFSYFVSKIEREKLRRVELILNGNKIK